jgi:hypothetical protein
MSRKEYHIPSQSATDPPIRFFICDTADDVPGAEGIYDADFVFVIEDNALFFGHSEQAIAFISDDYGNWEDTEDAFSDTSSYKQALDQLAGRVQALEDIL